MKKNIYMKKIVKVFPFVFLMFGIAIVYGQSKENEFWKWFEKNQQNYFSLTINSEGHLNLYGELSRELRKVHPELKFFFGPFDKNRKREFSITVDGRKEYFPFVKKLVDEVPKLENWTINAFVPETPKNIEIRNFGKYKLGYDNIYYSYLDSDDKLKVQLHVPNYNDSTEMEKAVLFVLKMLIGEYDLAMAIDEINLVKLNKNKIKKLSSLSSLRTLIEERKLD